MVGCTVPSLRNLSRLPPPSHPHWWIGIQGLMRVKKHHQAHISTGHFQGALACGGEAQEMSNQWWVGVALPFFKSRSENHFLAFGLPLLECQDSM